MIITKGLAPCEFRLASGTRDTPNRFVFGLVWYLCQRFWVCREKIFGLKIFFGTSIFFFDFSKFRKIIFFRQNIFEQKLLWQRFRPRFGRGPAPRAKSSLFYILLSTESVKQKLPPEFCSNFLQTYHAELIFWEVPNCPCPIVWRAGAPEKRSNGRERPAFRKIRVFKTAKSSRGRIISFITYYYKFRVQLC